MRGVLAHRDFRLLWLGQAFSTIGDRLVVVALALYVTDIGTPSDVGLVLAAKTVPFVLLLLLGGVWGDRLPRHLVMVAADVVRGAAHALLAVLIFTDAIEIWHIVAIEAVFGSAEAFFRPAHMGLLPQTVPEDRIQEANGLTATTTMLANFLGPALATALVLGVGAGTAFALDAATFALSAMLLLRVRPRARGAVMERVSMVHELREGWSAVRSRTWVWAIIGAAAVALVTALAPFLTLGPTLAEEVHGERGFYGVLSAALGAGMVLGAVVASRWRVEHPLRTAQAWILPWSWSVAAFALGAPEVLLVIAFVLGGIGIGFFNVWWETVLAERIPPHLLSRVSAYDWMGSTALLPVGLVLAGPLAEAFGTVEVVVAGAVLASLGEAAALCTPSVWRLKRQASPDSGRPESVVEASA